MKEKICAPRTYSLKVCYDFRNYAARISRDARGLNYPGITARAQKSVRGLTIITGWRRVPFREHASQMSAEI